MLFRRSASDMIDILLKYFGDCASPIAQLVERAAVNLNGAGSNPAGRATILCCYVEALLI